MLNKIQIENRRILVIDDNEAIHEDYRKVLAPTTASVDLDETGASLFDEAPAAVHNKSFELSFADQGQLGFHRVEQAVAAKTPYAVAFIDMRMPPGWDGLMTSEQLWKVDPHIQIVICTAFSDHPWDEITARLGKPDQLLILRKPFDAVEVEQLAVSLTYKWELARRVQMRIDGINALVDLRYKELRKANERLEKDVALRAAALSNRNEEFQRLNDEFQQFVKDVQRINTVDSVN